MDSLQNLIRGLYDQSENQDVILAENNLIRFFRKLEAINARLLKEVSESLQDKGNKDNHEYFRSRDSTCQTS